MHLSKDEGTSLKERTYTNKVTGQNTTGPNLTYTFAGQDKSSLSFGKTGQKLYSFFLFLISRTKFARSSEFARSSKTEGYMGHINSPLKSICFEHG